RRPHRALRRAGAGRRTRRVRHRGRELRRVSARQREERRLWLRAGGESSGAAHGEIDPRPRRGAEAAPCGRRPGRGHLPRACVAACRRHRGGTMIARVRGRPVALDSEGLIVDVAGVGYRLFATPSAVLKAEGADEVVLETHQHVRDDALQLYGFADAGERELFEQLLSVGGVGPKVALAIVSGYSPGELKRAIVREDADLFQTIPGIGKKTAQRVVLELKEKIAPLTAVAGPPAPGAGDGHLVARDALV